MQPSNQIVLVHIKASLIIAESEAQLQGLINVIVAASEKKGLMLNSAKSFTMVFSKSPNNVKP